MTLSYNSFGTGDRHVFALHGWFGNEACYEPMFPALTASDFTYVFPAYRGYGGSKTISGNYTITEIATDILLLADQLGWQRFSLIGHSMGGMVVQRILADAPSRVEKIVAVAPVPANGIKLDDTAKRFFASAARDLQARRAIIDQSSGSRLSPAWLDHATSISEKSSEPEAVAGYFKAWSDTNFVSEIAGNTTPLKVIIGEHDPHLKKDVMSATYLAWYPNASIEIMTNAGHYPMDETPVALATAIERFLRS